MSVRQIMPGALRYSLMTNMVDQSSSLNKPFLLSALFLSGFAALIYEIVWQRILVRFLGGNFSSVSLIVSVFLGGMAIGAMLVSIAQSKNKINNPGKVWAALEGVIGICGAGSILLARMTESPFAQQSVTTAIAIFLLLIPTIAMGAILPLAIDLFNQFPTYRNSQITLKIYALNTSGALAGATICAFVFLPLLGINFTLAIGAAVNIALCTILNSFKFEKKSSSDFQESEFEFNSTFVYQLSFISGLSIMLLELGWTRFFSLLGGANTYMFSLVLIFVLAGLSIGAWLVGDIKKRFSQNSNSLLAVTTITALSAFCLALSLHATYNFPNYYSHFIFELQKSIPGLSYFQAKLMILATGLNVMILFPCAVNGTLFPLLLGSDNSNSSSNRSRNAAIKLALNTTGSVCGYLILINLANSPLNNDQKLFDACFLVVIAVLSAYSLVLFLKQRLRVYIAIYTIAVFLSVMSKPTHTLPNSHGATTHGFENIESVVVVEEEQGLIKLFNNGKPQGSIPSPLPSDWAPITSDKPTQVLLGVLPPLMYAANQSSGLVIGIGTGTTCGAAIALDSVKQCTVVDINPAMFRAAYCFASSNQSPWDSPKFKKVVADARNFLAYDKTKFDWITSQPGEPSNAGSADLYTREFYQLAKSKLNSDGVFAQWIQLYGLTPKDLITLLDTFKSVFPETYIFQARGGGEIILLSIPPGPRRLSLEQRCKNIDFSNSYSKQLYTIGLENSYDLYADCISIPTKRSSNSYLNTDDNLKVELSSAKLEPPSEKQIQSLEDTLFTICKLDKQNDPLFEQARKARFMPLYTTVSDYFILSALEPELVAPLLKTDRKESTAALLIKSGKFREAKTVFESCPNQAAPANLTGAAICSYKLGEDPNQCYAKLIQSLDINPLQYLANYYAAKCLYKMERYQDALFNMRLASQIFPKSNLPHFYVIALLYRTGQIDLAKKNIERLKNRLLNTAKEKQWLDGLNKTISTGNEDPCIKEILKP